MDNAFAKSAKFMNKLKNKITSTSASKPNQQELHKPHATPRAVPSSTQAKQRDSVAPLFSSRLVSRKLS
jgi:hypothetical protein